MSLLNRFVPKGAGEPEKKSSPPTPYRRMFSTLEAENKDARMQYPEDSDTVEDFMWALKNICRTRYKKALNDPDPIRAEAQFFLSKDRMSAYACLLPPENDGDGITLEEFLGDLHYEGIHYGILEQEIPREFARGYLHMFPVARGKAPQPGIDGKVTELFQRRKNMRLEVQDGSQVDFGQDVQLQPIRKGTVICLIRAPREGTVGVDVTGQELSCPEPLRAEIPQGENTRIDRGGQALTAGVDGILYMENDRFCIHAQKIIDGDVDQFQGTLRISGNLYIGGSVDGGAEIEASGDIVINGKVGQARLTSTGGTIRVQQGVFGTAGSTFLKADGQVQASVMEWAEIEAGTSVIAGAILESTIRCGGVVYVMSGRGIIADSQIQAGDSILCQRVGNLAGGRSCFSVGYPPHVLESWKRIKEELAAVQATVEKMWKPITTLRRKGVRISDQEKALLDQLAEQRDLYMERQESLLSELKIVNKALSRKSKGRIRCEKLYPYLDVQIGRLTEEIITIEEGCSIHAEDNRIFMK